MTNQEKQEAIKAWDAWCEEHRVTLNGVKEIRASQDAWLGCWSFLFESFLKRKKALFAIKAIVDNEIGKPVDRGED